MFIRCPYCHERVFALLYLGHRARHKQRLPDGQMTDHVTMEVEDRYQGSLEGLPSEYHHPDCDGWTVMPDEVMRSYLANPFLYEGTFCCGCGDYVDTEDVYWEETGESLADYFLKLRAEYVLDHDQPPPFPPGIHNA